MSCGGPQVGKFLTAGWLSGVLVAHLFLFSSHNLTQAQLRAEVTKEFYDEVVCELASLYCRHQPRPHNYRVIWCSNTLSPRLLVLNRQ